MECTSEDLDITEISKKGEIKTFTEIKVSPKGFDAPYIVAMVELDEGPWVMGNIIDVDPYKADRELIGKKW